MDRTPPTAHAGHDELLIARLFGGDVSEAERARALAVVSECPECESLLADVGAIAEATRALPVPPRPRDFSLTAADAARLRGKTRVRRRVFGLGLRRSLGGSLAALGIVGLVLTGTTSVLDGSASTNGGRYALSPEGAAAPPAPGAIPAASVAGSLSNLAAVDVVTAAPAATIANDVPTPAPSAARLVTDTASSGMPAASPSAGSEDLAAASAATAQSAVDGGSGSTKTTEAPDSSSSGVDARLVLLIGFAALFVTGLALAILPVRRRRRDRGAGS